LVVLRDDLARERECWLVGAEVVDVEDEVVGEVLLAPPDHPSDAGVDEAVLVPADVDALHQRQPEVPLQLRGQERRDEPAARRVHVDGSVPPRPPVLGGEQVVEALHVFELAGERGPQDCRSVQTFFLLWFCNRFPFRGVAVHARAYALIYCLRRRGRGKPERRYYLCFACPMT
jgi:hypothetical protein